MRGMSGSFEHAIRGINASKHSVPVAMSSTITRENIDTVHDILDIGNDLDVPINFQIEYDYSTAEKISPEKNKLLSVLNMLIDSKRNDGPIMNTVQYFESIKNSWFYGTKWECRPWLIMDINYILRVFNSLFL